MKYAYFKGNIVPFDQAKIGIMTHAFNYGTAVFEGIRGYWNAEKKQMYILEADPHLERLFRSASALSIGIKLPIEELKQLLIELVKKNGYKEDLYIRPIAYKSEEKIGLGLKGIADELCIFLSPFGVYLDINKGIKVCISSWRRIFEQSLPPGAKINGAYFNSSLAKSEALEKGYDEAILLSHAGTVAEGSGENIFIIKDGQLITPPLTENILPGITRENIIEIAENELDLTTIEERIKPTQLYNADELFFCGTGAQVTPIASVDNKTIGNGSIGPITKKIQSLYFSAARGELSSYKKWLTPVF